MKLDNVIDIVEKFFYGDSSNIKIVNISERAIDSMDNMSYKELKQLKVENVENIGFEDGKIYIRIN